MATPAMMPIEMAVVAAEMAMTAKGFALNRQSLCLTILEMWIRLCRYRGRDLLVSSMSPSLMSNSIWWHLSRHSSRAVT